MDQDFHYYGTLHSAITAGYSKDDAKLIALAANFIDCFSESTYASYWNLVAETEPAKAYNVLAKVENPRYTYQGSLTGSGLSPEDGLWCSYHFLPGNYNDPADSHSRLSVHGEQVVALLPSQIKRDTSGGLKILKKYSPHKAADLNQGKMLTRPQSALSRALIKDTIRCANDNHRLIQILNLASGGKEILKTNLDDVLKRFKLILIGIRAHVIADTWAHQDHCGLDNVMNTYWDVNYDPNSWDPSKSGYGRQSISYIDTSAKWKNQVLSATNKLPGGNANFEAAPSGTSYLGHGWLGHFPDFSFIKFKYKPCWANPECAKENPEGVILRDNPAEYRSAWIELTSMFHQARTNQKLNIDKAFKTELEEACKAISRPCELAKPHPGRKNSADAWLEILRPKQIHEIDVIKEPDSKAILSGMVAVSQDSHRYGTSYVNIQSDLYLFQIAADYHFHFIKHYLKKNDIYHFTGSWSQQTSALSKEVEALFENTLETA